MFRMDPQKRKETVTGPAIVAVANSMRAFDAPVRNPMLMSSLPTDFWWNPSSQNLVVALKLSGLSSLVVTIEHIIGALIITPFILFRRGKYHLISVLRQLNKNEWISLVFISLGSGLGLYFFLISFGMGNPSVAILIQKTQPVITLFVAMIILKERPTKFYYVAVIFALLGVYLIAIENILNANAFEFVAALCSLIAAIFWGSNTVFGRLLTEKTDYWDLTAFRYIGGSIILIFFLIPQILYIIAYTPDNLNFLGTVYITFPEFKLFQIPMWGITCILYATIFTGGIIPLVLYYYGLRWSKASVGGLAELAFPLLAIFVNFYALGFGLSETQILGAIILFGVVSAMTYINKKEYEKDESNRKIQEGNKIAES